jgi:hypothetical protein
MSGERGGHVVGPSLTVHRFGNVTSKNWRTSNPQCGGAENYPWRFHFVKPKETLCFLLHRRHFDNDDCSTTKVVHRLCNCTINIF